MYYNKEKYYNMNFMKINVYNKILLQIIVYTS